MYGGYVDLISGELVQEFKQCKINELSWSYFSDGACFATGKNTPNDILKDKSLLISYIRSNYYKPIDGYGSISSYANKQDYSISLYAPSDQLFVALTIYGRVLMEKLKLNIGNINLGGNNYDSILYHGTSKIYGRLFR